MAAVVERWGGLHVLYNNAGIFPQDDGSVVETPESTWDRVMNINLKGVFLMCRYGIPAMLESGGGSIVNVASFVALMGAATPQIAYTASKGGVLSMTREIAVEFARRRVRANALCPGPIETPLLMGAREFGEIGERIIEGMVSKTVMRRLGSPDEVAAAIAFLASDEASFITGAILPVDGGYLAQ